jgi:HEAT repeat protein
MDLGYRTMRSRRHLRTGGVLLQKLQTGPSEARVKAIFELGQLKAGTRRSPTMLIQALKDRDELVRIETAIALMAIGDRRALPALRKALRDRSGLVRSYVAEAIGKLGTARDVAMIKRELGTERSARARIGYYSALYRFNPYDSISGLLALLENGDYRVRCASANTLGRVVMRSDERIALDGLRSALRREKTVAARSSERAAIRAIAQHRRNTSR